jgi:hypothetical protein
MGMFSDIDYSLIVLQLEKAMANGVATLDSNTKVPKAQISLTASDVGAIASTGNEVLTSLNAASGTISSGLLPSYVDDVLSYTNLAGFPGTGETGKIYVAEDSNKVYRWSGSVYVEISSSATAGEALKLTTPRTITTTGDASYSVSFDGSANVTSAITLATVNSNAGSFGSASSIPAITVNAKGQVTAVSTNSIGNELIALQSLSDTPGFLKKTGDGTYSIDINSYLSLTGGTITGNLAVNGSILGSAGAGVSLYQVSGLGSTSGDFQVLSSKTGISGNITTERTWLRRKTNGSQWDSASLHNGITVDTFFNIPGSTTRTWWERDILAGIQSWGDGATTYFSVNSTRFNIPLSTQSTSPTTGASVIGGGQGIGGNQYIGGFSSLGGDANHPGIKIKVLTGTTAATQGGGVSIAHGIADISKIISVNLWVNTIQGVGLFAPPNYTNGGIQYNFILYGDYINVENHPSNSYSLLSKPVTITIIYTA